MSRAGVSTAPLRRRWPARSQPRPWPQWRPQPVSRRRQPARPAAEASPAARSVPGVGAALRPSALRTGSPTERRLREARFLLVPAQTTNSRQAALRQLGTSDGSAATSHSGSPDAGDGLDPDVPLRAGVRRPPHHRRHRDRCGPGAAAPGRGRGSRSGGSGSGGCSVLCHRGSPLRCPHGGTPRGG